MKTNTFCAVDFGNDCKEQIYTDTYEEAAAIAAKSKHGTAYYVVEVTDNDGNIENCYFDPDSLEGAIRDALSDESNDEESKAELRRMLEEEISRKG